MHNIENYGGRRIGDSGIILVQFPNEERMYAWISLMRKYYIDNTFCPIINREAYIVAY